MSAAGTSTNDPRSIGPGFSIGSPDTFPSVVGIDLLIADQIGEYSPKDLQKIAMDIKAGVPKAREAFHYIYSRMMGWE